MVAAGLRVCAVLITAGALAGVALFRADLVELVPFVGAKGMAAPAIFAILVASVGLLFWGVADTLVSLAAHADSHARQAPVALADPERPAPRALASRTERPADVGDVPGFQRYQRPMPRVMKWTANVTNGPAYLGTSVCEIPSGEMVTAIGEVAEFAFVETSSGNGWLPKDALTDLLASA